MTIITKQVEELLQLQTDIETNFRNAKIRAEEEKKSLTAEVKNKELETKEIYTLMVLDDVDVTAYQLAKNELVNMQDLLRIAKSKVENIDSMMLNELRDKVYNPYTKLKREHAKENNANQKKVNQEMFQAKADYLIAIHEAKAKVNSTDNVLNDIEDLEVKLGIRKTNYRGLSHYTNKLEKNFYNGREGLNIDMQEIVQAYDNGVISNKLKGRIKEG